MVHPGPGFSRAMNKLPGQPGHGPSIPASTCVALFGNTDWYLYNFRAPLARTLARQFGARVLVVCPDGPYRPRLEAEGFTWVPVELRRRGLNPLVDLVAAWRLGRALKPWRPDLLHAFTLKSILVGALAAKKAGIPRVVAEVTGAGALFAAGAPRSYRLARWALRRLLRWKLADSSFRLVFQHVGDQEVVFPTGAPGTVRLIPGSGVDTIRFQPAEPQGGDPIVLLAGRLLKSKGIACFCEAARLVAGDMPRARFWVAGSVDPDNPDSLTEDELGELKDAHPEVTFLGHCADMPERYRQASVAVLASRHEGVPRTLTEAAACGLPLVATALPGVQGLVVEGVNGFQVPVGDSRAMAHVLLLLLADASLRERMGSASRRIVQEGFDLEQVLARTVSCYREVGYPPGAGAP